MERQAGPSRRTFIGGAVGLLAALMFGAPAAGDPPHVHCHPDSQQEKFRGYVCGPDGYRYLMVDWICNVCLGLCRREARNMGWDPDCQPEEEEEEEDSAFVDEQVDGGLSVGAGWDRWGRGVAGWLCEQPKLIIGG
ncbi:MAG TPA: hypothetical protein VF230_17075 [Acidimicrobiales bacterium]